MFHIIAIPKAAQASCVTTLKNKKSRDAVETSNDSNHKSEALKSNEHEHESQYF